MWRQLSEEDIAFLDKIECFEITKDEDVSCEKGLVRIYKFKISKLYYPSSLVKNTRFVINFNYYPSWGINYYPYPKLNNGYRVTMKFEEIFDHVPDYLKEELLFHLDILNV